MLFNTTAFAIFFVVVLTVWTLLRPLPRARLWWLLVASVGFYASWDWRYVFLLLGVTFTDWALGLWLQRTDEARARQRIVALAVAANLGVLALWKYSDLVLDTLRWALSSSPAWADRVPAPLHWVLPIGISFYTFQGLGYVVDVYRRKHPAFPSPWKFALAKAFFPQLVAGPIVRPGDIVPQFDAPKTLDDARLARGLVLVLRGLVKKAVADALAAGIVDRVFDLPEQYSTVETLAAVYGYAFQIYGDFSGYTDVAIGSALLLGFDLPVNFDHPYRATSLREFWRRWHISLSSWLRDYLYIALGGGRGGFWRTQRNLIATMLLGGLWHGASWNFVLWGALHGAGLVVERLLAGRAEPTPAPAQAPGGLTMRSLAGWFVTFHVVVALWVFFRADTFAGALAVFAQLARGQGGGAANVTTTTATLLALAFALHFVPDRFRARGDDALAKLPAFAQALVVVLTLYVLQLVGTGTTQPFIYFQF